MRNSGSVLCFLPTRSFCFDFWGIDSVSTKNTIFRNVTPKDSAIAAGQEEEQAILQRPHLLLLFRTVNFQMQVFFVAQKKRIVTFSIFSQMTKYWIY